MEWQLNANSKFNNQMVAREILQIYMESLQDHKKLRGILSEHSILDYFGKSFYGQEDVCSELITNLYGSSFELSSLTTDSKEPFIDWNSICEMKAYKVEEELGVSLMSTPTSSFPGLTFSTPPATVRKKTVLCSERGPFCSSLDCKLGLKKIKLDYVHNTLEGSLSTSKIIQISPRAMHNQIPSNMKFISSFGTICYSKRVVSASDPKKMKHHSVGTLRDRFCHLYIGFQYDEHFISITNCKIWIIKYGISSKMTPRNLLKLFDEADYD